MKKSILIFTLCLSGLAVMATEYTAFGKMTLKGSSSKVSDNLMFFASNSFVNGRAYDDGGDSPEPMTGQTMYFYAIGSDNNYASYADTVFRDVPIAFKAPTEDKQFTISFSNWNVPSGKVYQLYDKKENKYIDVINSTSYSFSIERGGISITDRFVLEPTPPAYAICHQYGALAITGAKGKNVVVKDAQGVAQITEVLSSHYASVDLSSLSAGQYKVVVALDEGDKEYIILVQ